MGFSLADLSSSMKLKWKIVVVILDKLLFNGDKNVKEWFLVKYWKNKILKGFY